ncbi:hypothetical protein C3486_28630 [Streptomyces sp. Ru73]|uniref:hypothetical protein n=1 Tax=Streptomyces sp. Ru73 TaxID=2080748 RepID=UPI000CDD8E11|nr:hypothetical protein [Streptomyces sp. Ru73]POX37380.1 hypothetical protein C3486_28630 [Streptomyces sp. Ru73]
MTDEGTSREVRPDYPAMLARTRQGLRAAAGVAPILLPALTRFGGTNFENHNLDDMLDMIESARPSDLEHTGDALIDAADAIKEVGEELKKYAEHAEWDGESGEAMRKWTDNLSKNTLKLATYSKTAGHQLKNAGEGLATVKKSMPKRDADGGLAEAVKDIPTPARVDTNPAYAKAKKREGDRQEAITQMNKLSSYYIVSHDTMATQEEPVFAPMPDVGMPAPSYDLPIGEGGGKPIGAGGHAVQPVMGGHGPEAGGGDASQYTPHHRVIAPEQEIGTNIDSVTMPHPPADTHAPVPTSPPNSPGPIANQGNPLPPGPINTGPLPRGAGKLPGLSGPPRSGPLPGGGTARPNPMAPGAMRPNSPGQPGATGRPGPMGQPGTAGRPSGVSPRAIGRPGGTGLGPGANGARPGSGAMPRGGRNGIVGGTPSTPGRASTSSPGARAVTPGGEHGTTTGRGVIGAGAKTPAESSAERAASARRLATNQGGVVGTPRSEAGSAGRGQRGFTQGGTGLVHNTGGEEHPAGAPRGGAGTSQPRNESQKENRRPGQPTEDEETWNSGRRRNTAPPVIE